MKITNIELNSPIDDPMPWAGRYILCIGEIITKNRFLVMMAVIYFGIISPIHQLHLVLSKFVVITVCNTVIFNKLVVICNTCHNLL